MHAHFHRRKFLQTLSCCGAGFAASGLASRLDLIAQVNNASVNAPYRLKTPPRAKQLLIVFLTGGFSHVETFDYKPKLNADNGKTANVKGHAQSLLGSQFKFSPYGESGLMISEIFSELGSVIDDLCIIRSMKTDNVEHFEATLAMHTGSSSVPMPGIGGWLSYGLGPLNPNLPAYTVFCEAMPYAGGQNWDSLFLPPIHQGVRVIPGNDPIPNLKKPDAVPDSVVELQQDMLRDLNRLHWEKRGNDAQLLARDHATQVARGMIKVAPEVLDVSKETQSTLDLYNLKAGDNQSFAWQCLTARRLIEQGVRVVEIIESGTADNWDAHLDMQQHLPRSKKVNAPLAALIKDLKQRGLLDDTLVAICTEFGRTPFTFNFKGREHHADAFSCILAGGGTKGGIAFGETDEYGLAPIKDTCHIHDYHATILHLMGIDHEKLTYHYGGRDYRLTDVHGRVINELIA